MVVGHSNAVETGLDDHAGILPFNESKRTCALPADGTCAVNGQAMAPGSLARPWRSISWTEPDLKRDVADCFAVIEVTLHTHLMTVAIPARA